LKHKKEKLIRTMEASIILRKDHRQGEIEHKSHQLKSHVSIVPVQSVCIKMVLACEAFQYEVYVQKDRDVSNL
jgi:hypothetical protein